MTELLRGLGLLFVAVAKLLSIIQNPLSAKQFVTSNKEMLVTVRVLTINRKLCKNN